MLFPLLLSLTPSLFLHHVSLFSPHVLVTSTCLLGFIPFMLSPLPLSLTLPLFLTHVSSIFVFVSKFSVTRHSLCIFVLFGFLQASLNEIEFLLFLRAGCFVYEACSSVPVEDFLFQLVGCFV